MSTSKEERLRAKDLCRELLDVGYRAQTGRGEQNVCESERKMDGGGSFDTKRLSAVKRNLAKHMTAVRRDQRGRTKIPLCAGRQRQRGPYEPRNKYNSTNI